MADIAASDVTYTQISSSSAEGRAARYENLYDVAFGDGALTYPAGGVPLASNSLGMTTNIVNLNIVDAANANGFVYKYDATNNKIRVYQGDNDAGADGPLVELAGGAATPAAATIRVLARGY